MDGKLLSKKNTFMHRLEGFVASKQLSNLWEPQYWDGGSVYTSMYAIHVCYCSTNVSAYACVHACTYACTYARMREHVSLLACICEHVHTRVHEHNHARACACIHLLLCSFNVSLACLTPDSCMSFCAVVSSAPCWNNCPCSCASSSFCFFICSSIAFIISINGASTSSFR